MSTCIAFVNFSLIEVQTSTTDFTLDRKEEKSEGESENSHNMHSVFVLLPRLSYSNTRIIAYI